MAKVIGIGGVFFKVDSVPANTEWYRRVLGMEAADWGGMGFAHPNRGEVVWCAFPRDTKHFSPSSENFMINLLVEDIEAMVARIEGAGEKILHRDDTSDPNGRFAWLMDPNGIKIELWEPKA
jgi:catechol 2,3-dioxygenase-like lactoylglutathione lyase family enzyme